MIVVDERRGFCRGISTNQRWEGYSDLMTGYRNWLGQLPREVADRVACRNGTELFGGR